jgi:hypothetical protein
MRTSAGTRTTAGIWCSIGLSQCFFIKAASSHQLSVRGGEGSDYPFGDKIALHRGGGGVPSKLQNLCGVGLFRLDDSSVAEIAN